MVWMFLRRRREQDLDDELRQFVDDLTARNLARGMTPEAARRAALVETGGVQQVREATRDVWRFAVLETLARDVRYGLRMIARAPGFALVVIATLGLVIGANATVFSVMHAVLWRPLPYPEAHRVVVVESETRNTREMGVAPAEALDLRAEPGLFDLLANISTVDAHVNVDGDMDRVPAASVTDDALPILGAAPMAMGRTLQSATDGGRTSVVRAIVISHELWVRRFASDPHVIGRHIEVNNLDVEVVGVLRPGFRVYLPALAGAPEIVDVWFPSGFDNDRRNRFSLTLARLAPGVTVQHAQARLDLIADRSVTQHPASYVSGGLRLFVMPLQDKLTGDVREALWVLAGAVAFVLVIGCVNVATLMLARARAREQEMAVRRALGAARMRLVRQLFTEAALLGLAGAVLGFVLAHIGVAMVDWLQPAHLPRQATIAVTREVALFIGAITLVVSVIFGLLPAFASARDANQPLRSGRATVQRSGMRRLQRSLVIAEVALSIVPLVAAGLMLRTFVNMTQAPLGFDPSNLITAKVAFSFREFPKTADRARLLRDAVDRVRQIPGVQDAAIGAPLPLDGWQQTRRYAHPHDTSVTGRATMQSVMPGYLRVTRTPLVAGRDFTDADIDAERNVAIVDERIAVQLWPDGALGRQMAFQRGRDFVDLEIVGISQAVRATSVREEPLPHMFVPYHLWAVTPSLVARTAQSAEALAPAVKQRVESLGTRRPVFDVRPMQHYVDQSLGDTRFMMLVLVGFAGAAILLAAIGLYGTLAYLTSQRTQEFGVRMALGASAGRVLRSVAREGLVLAAVGASLGFAGAAATTGLLQGMLYHVTPLDGVTLITVMVLVSLTALAAALLPAWRASRVNPSLVLRAGE
jgi:predicted permease